MKPTYRKMYNTIVFFTKGWRSLEEMKRYYIDTLNYLIEEKYINGEQLPWHNHTLTDVDETINEYTLTTKWKTFYNEYSKNILKQIDLRISDYKVLGWGILWWLISYWLIELIKILVS